MERFLEKLEEYNIFNYLIPGIIFTYLLKYYIGIDIFQESALEMVVIYYFVGSVINRIGSVVIESIMKKMEFVKHLPYEDYIYASKEDKSIEKLSMVNNMYRTISSIFITLIVLKCITKCFNVAGSTDYTAFIVAGAILYLFSYRKQTNFITKRILYVKNKK